MSARRTRALRWLLPCVSIALFWALAAAARPGGGNTYSGGSHSSYSSGSHSSYSGGGGGSSGGDGGFILQLLLLCFNYPALGVPLLVICIGFFVAKAMHDAKKQGWSTSAGDQEFGRGATSVQDQVRAVGRVEQTNALSRMDLDGIRRLDPEFSLVLFEDFVYMLYAAVQRARGSGAQALAPYLAPNLAATLASPALADVQGIVIGALRYVRFSGTQGPMLDIELEIEANYVEVLKAGGTQRFYVMDRIVLSRSSSARSRRHTRKRSASCTSRSRPITSTSSSRPTRRSRSCAACKAWRSGARRPSTERSADAAASGAAAITRTRCARPRKRDEASSTCS